jgi:hypothetical protein
LNTHTLFFKVIDKDEYKATIKNLKPKIFSGPDGIPPYMLIIHSEVLMYPLCLLSNLILEMQTFPNIWKSTRVCPILKSGESSKIENYRPIATVCSPAKVLEQILESNISESQHGFFSRRSTITNLINFVQNVFNAFHNRS